MAFADILVPDRADLPILVEVEIWVLYQVVLVAVADTLALYLVVSEAVEGNLAQYQAV